VSFQDVVSRVSEIRSMEQLLLGGPRAAAAATTSQSTGPGTSASASGSSAGQSFADALGSAISSGTTSTTASRSSATPAATTTTTPTETDYGAKALAIAQGEIGQAEQPPGSNDSPRIAVYRSAVQGAVAGQPWCAYFVSWAVAQAGAPLGDNGQGLGSVAQIADWAQRTGRLLPAGATPRPGDLILFGTHHVGIVESVAADGTITTVEGNTGDAVRRRQRSAGEATGFVRL
jgi:cell wall-associated NlpC family hydrolase